MLKLKSAFRNGLNFAKFIQNYSFRVHIKDTINSGGGVSKNISSILLYLADFYFFGYILSRQGLEEGPITPLQPPLDTLMTKC